MSRSIGEVSVRELLPESIRHDETIKAAAAGLDAGTAEILAAVRRLSFWEYLDDLSGPILSHLAARLHVDLWDPAWSDAQKRLAIRDSIAIHKYKGTPWAVETLLRPLADVTLQEWFEYGGEPYTCRVLVNSSVTNEDLYREIDRAVRLGKNTRTHFSVIRLPRAADGHVRIGGAVHLGIRQTIRTAEPHFTAQAGRTRIGGAVHAGLRYTIQSQQ